MTPADSHSVAPDMIVRVVEAELETLTQVLEMLDIEHEALMGNDAERLEQAVAAKQNAISAPYKAEVSAKHLVYATRWQSRLRRTPASSMDFENER